MKRTVFVVSLLAIAASVIAGEFIFDRAEPKVLPQPSPVSSTSDNNIKLNDESETAFYEITIPYLRGREYDSQLSKLVLYFQDSSYTSYLTSFNSDQYQVNALLTIPSGQQPEGGWPAVVFVHGYIPPDEYETTGNYESYVDYLASADLVVFKIDLRGHGDSEGEPSGAYYSGDYVVDVLSAYNAIQKADFVNSERVGLWGHSMGGNVVFRAFVAAQNIPAVVIWAGAVYTYDDFSEYCISDFSYQRPSNDSPRARDRQRLFDTHGYYSTDSGFWRMVPATNYLEDVSGAVEIHHAVNDNVVDIGYSRGLVEVLEDTTIRHKLYEYTSGGHNITGASFTSAMDRTASFFNEM